MKKKDAYTTLGIAETATPEEVKKAFKKLAVKYHPDTNKAPDAEAQFKKVNEAYQNIENNTFDDAPPNFGGMPFSGNINFQDLLGGFGFGNQRRQQYSPPPADIKLDQTISFKESILGCKRELTYACDVMCNKCEGNGEYLIDNGCATCKGRGRIVGQQGNMFFERTCNKCGGKVKSEKCVPCMSKGKIASQRTITISVKPGITDGSVLRLMGVGNFGSNFGYSNVFVSIKVTPEPNLTLQGNDVVTNVDISLLEALTGCSKKIITIDGEQEVTIPAATKNKDEVILSTLGVDRKGNERVIININYPQDTSKLIELLKEGSSL